jgi:NitT/TauT family transport system ATP-binding protein
MNSSPVLKVTNLSKSFPTENGKLEVLDNISFSLQSGDFLSIVGPSGCGKSTLLEILASLQSASSGKVEKQKAKINNNHSNLSLFVFQQYNRSMLPFLTVAGNVHFVLDSIKAITKQEKIERVKESLAITKLTDFENYYPWQLSGGMQQRVAFARIVAARPKIVLLDEAFGSLDAQTTYELEDELLDLTNKYNLTTIYVTHDIGSAIYCGKRIIVLSGLPANIISDINNELPYPRHQIDTRNDKRFLEYRKEIYSLIKGK